MVTRLIYLLMKFTGTERVFFEKFAADLAKEAKGRFHSVSVEKTTYKKGHSEYSFRTYIDGRGWQSGITPKEAIDKQKKKKESPIKEILD